MLSTSWPSSSTAPLTHDWDAPADLSAGDVAVLRSGRGLRHDERAGDDGARVLQCYLRAADPVAPPSHRVVRRADGWVDLGRPDARLWVGRGGAAPPPGIVLAVGDEGVAVGGRAGPGQVVVVWDLDLRRPDWAS